MAGYTKHIFFSLVLVTLGILVLNYYLDYFPFGIIDILILLPIIILYAMLPDIDHPNSRIRQIMLTFFSVVFVITLGVIAFMVWHEMSKLYIYMALGVGVFEVVVLLAILSVKHRGSIHTPLAGALFALPVLYIFKFNWLYYLVAWVSYMGHLVLDGEVNR